MVVASSTASALPTAQVASPGSFDILSFLLGALDDGDEEGRRQRWSSFIGITVAICGNILISFALNIQRYAHVRIDREADGDRVHMRSRRRASASTGDSFDVPYRDDADYENAVHNAANQAYSDNEERDRYTDSLEHSLLSDHTLRQDGKVSLAIDRPSYLHSPYWWAGIVLMTLGEMGNFLAYGFAPASIVSPLGVVALVSNCIIAPFLLKEKFRQRDFWGVLVAIAGAVVVVLSAETSETKIGPHDIWIMITKWEFELYLGITAALIVILMYLSDKYGGRTILIDLGLVGLFGGYTALSTKGVASLLSFTLWHIITFPISYLLITVLVLSALMQVRYINRALQNFDSTQVIPTQFVLFTLSVIIGSAVLYRDFETATLSRSLKFIGGCGLTFLGVYFITSGRISQDDDVSYEDEDEEAGVNLLNEERYRDSIDETSPLQPHLQPSHGMGFDGASPARQESTRSTTSEDLEEQSLSTPKGLLSPIGSDQGDVTSDDLLSQDLTTPSPSIHSQSLIDNPWSSPEDVSRPPPLRSNSHLAQEDTPTHSPARQSRTQQTPPLLLRFPAAPTPEETTSTENTETRRESLQLPADAKSPGNRRRSTPRTPNSNHRNSVTLRLTPSPLIAPLSSTLSAVVAESLLRGEGSAKHQRSKSLRTRRPVVTAFVTDGTNHENLLGVGDGDTAVGTYQIRSSAVTMTPGSSRFNSQNDVRPSNTRSIQDVEENHDEVATTRIRSLSDSITGHLAWIGGAFFSGKRQSRPTLSAQAAEGESNTPEAES